LASLKSPPPGGRVTSAAKRDGTDMTFLPRQRFGAHYSGIGVQAFSRLACSDAVFGGDE
jgi:hypothetical protein